MTTEDTHSDKQNGRIGSLRQVIPNDIDLAYRSERTADRIGSQNWKLIYLLEEGVKTDSLICRLRGEKNLHEYSQNLDRALNLWKEASIISIKTNDPLSGESYVITRSSYVYAGRNLTIAICRAYVGSQLMTASVKTQETIKAWELANQLFA